MRRRKAGAVSVINATSPAFAATQPSAVTSQLPK